jgi:hypothetical protein
VLVDRKTAALCISLAALAVAVVALLVAVRHAGA